MKILFSFLFIFFGIYITIWNIFVDPYIKKKDLQKKLSSFATLMLFVSGYLVLGTILLIFIEKFV